MTRLLAIETSCDDTSLSVVHFQDNIFAVDKLVAYSQIQDHQQYGGVVPEIAARMHADKIIALIDAIGATSTIQELDAIAVTTHPGLPGSLVVGKTAAYFLAHQYTKNLIPVNHIHGHLFSIFLDRDYTTIKFPAVILTASGGHNDLYLIDTSLDNITNISHIEKSYEKIGPYYIYRLGHTLDDAAGEAFDKVSRMLGGPYPGGAWIGQQASKGKQRDDIHFKRIFLSKHEYNFSFSGMKSQVHYLLQTFEHTGYKISDQDICDIAYAFQESIVEVLAKKLIRAWLEYDAKTIAIVGGVSANTRLAEYITEYLHKKNINIPFIKPTKHVYCTDNGAMIGAAAIISQWN